jgi:predicted HTH domain antitoxin
LEYVEKVAEEDHLDKATEFRRLLQSAIELDRVERAVRAYANSEVTLLKAAELAELPVSLFVDELASRNIRRGLGVEAFLEGMEVLNRHIE